MGGFLAGFSGAIGEKLEKQHEQAEQQKKQRREDLLKILMSGQLSDVSQAAMQREYDKLSDPETKKKLQNLWPMLGKLKGVIGGQQGQRQPTPGNAVQAPPQANPSAPAQTQGAPAAAQKIATPPFVQNGTVPPVNGLPSPPPAGLPGYDTRFKRQQEAEKFQTDERIRESQAANEERIQLDIQRAKDAVAKANNEAELKTALKKLEGAQKLGLKIQEEQWKAHEAELNRKHADELEKAKQEGRKQLVDERAKVAPAKKGRAVNAVPSPGGGKSQVQEIGDAIIAGKDSPEMVGLNRTALGGQVRAYLDSKGYNLAKAQLDWKTTQRHLNTLNGPQQERLRQAVQFTYDSTNKVEELYNAWTKTSLPSGFKVYNRAALIASTNLPGDAGVAAQTLLTQINDLTSEVGTVYKGGNSSTDESLKLAASNLKGQWNPEQFHAAVDQLRKNLQLRKNSIEQSTTAGVESDNPYEPQHTAKPVSGILPSPTKTVVLDPKDKAGYDALPKGSKYTVPGDKTVYEKQ